MFETEKKKKRERIESQRVLVLKKSASVSFGMFVDIDLIFVFLDLGWNLHNSFFLVTRFLFTACGDILEDSFSLIGLVFGLGLGIWCLFETSNVGNMRIGILNKKENALNKKSIWLT